MNQALGAHSSPSTSATPEVPYRSVEVPTRQPFLGTQGGLQPERLFQDPAAAPGTGYVRPLPPPPPPMVAADYGGWAAQDWEASGWHEETPAYRGGPQRYDMSSRRGVARRQDMSNHRGPAPHMRHAWQETPRESGAWTPGPRRQQNLHSQDGAARCQKPCGRCGNQCSFPVTREGHHVGGERF